MVLCSKTPTCTEASQCGGAQPHQREDDECGKCPMDKEAKCLEIPSETIKL